mmetsp:Transcript_13964/g.23659  ORF Transcript_13964/g.23659 Transcript_13964/m.23659 type:complete len:247 (-) Transcript_13964:159-899(-)
MVAVARPAALAASRKNAAGNIEFFMLQVSAVDGVGTGTKKLAILSAILRTMKAMRLKRDPRKGILPKVYPKPFENSAMYSGSSFCTNALGAPSFSHTSITFGTSLMQLLSAANTTVAGASSTLLMFPAPSMHLLKASFVLSSSTMIATYGCVLKPVGARAHSAKHFSSTPSGIACVLSNTLLVYRLFTTRSKASLSSGIVHVVRGARWFSPCSLREMESSLFLERPSIGEGGGALMEGEGRPQNWA